MRLHDAVKTLFILAAISGTAGCANELGGSEPEGSQGPVGVQSSELAVDAAGLRKDHSTLLVDKLTNAENLVFTSDGRLFASGDDGVYEIVRDASGKYQSHPVHTGESCKFGGLTEVHQVLYANCFDYKNSQLFAAALTASPDLHSIFTLPGISLANGLTTDGNNSLFIAAMVQGQILRLQLAPNDPLHISEQEVWVPNAGLFVNGIKYFRGAIYWTDFGNIKTVAIASDGSAGPTQTLVSLLAFFDDLYVDASGILVASSLAGTLQAFDFHGLPTGASPASTFNMPSSVLPTLGRLGLPDNAFVVTERGASKLSLLGP